MPTVLDQTSALKGLAELWEEHAQAQQRYDADDPKAKTLRQCASDVRRIIGEMTPEWVPIRTVRATTGQSIGALRRRCEYLVEEGMARRGSGGRWEIALQAALEIPVRRDRVRLETDMDIDQLARVFGREE